MTPRKSLKTRTAHTLKWNVIDRVSSQLLYAITGVVLARMLSDEEMGLVGAVLVFQAFANLLIDSGFSTALIQRKRPTQLDYSTILWFNIAVACALYVLLWWAAPLIARCFDNDQRIIPLARVMFLSFIISATAIVQTNRLVKRMDVRMVAVANSLGLIGGAVAGISLAVTGHGAWAIVWQTIVLQTVRSAVLWTTGRWAPSTRFSWASLRSFFSVGSRMMLTSFLNTVFVNIYSFFIGNRGGLASLGYYTQGDKWSKMGIQSLSQVLTSSFLPVLSAVQDEPERFRAIVSKMNRFTAYLLFPAMIGLCVTARPLFHLLFGTKWDLSILLFQLLLVRGIFTVLTALYNNYIIALGNARMVLRLEVVRDSVALAAFAATFPFMTMSTPTNPVAGVAILIGGQILASVVAYVATLVVTARTVGNGMTAYLRDLAPYAVMTLVIAPLMLIGSTLVEAPAWKLAVECGVGLGAYLTVNSVLNSRIQDDLLAYLRGKPLDLDTH